MSRLERSIGYPEIIPCPVHCEGEGANESPWYYLTEDTRHKLRDGVEIYPTRIIVNICKISLPFSLYPFPLSYPPSRPQCPVPYTASIWLHHTVWSEYNVRYQNEKLPKYHEDNHGARTKGISVVSFLCQFLTSVRELLTKWAAGGRGTSGIKLRDTCRFHLEGLWWRRKLKSEI